MFNLAAVFGDIQQAETILNFGLQAADHVATASGTVAKVETAANIAAGIVSEVAGAKGVTVDLAALPGECVQIYNFFGSMFGRKPAAAPAAAPAAVAPAAAGPVAVAPVPLEAPAL